MGLEETAGSSLPLRELAFSGPGRGERPAAESHSRSFAERRCFLMSSRINAFPPRPSTGPGSQVCPYVPLSTRGQASRALQFQPARQLTSRSRAVPLCLRAGLQPGALTCYPGATAGGGCRTEFLPWLNVF